MSRIQFIILIVAIILAGIIASLGLPFWWSVIGCWALFIFVYLELDTIEFWVLKLLKKLK